MPKKITFQNEDKPEETLSVWQEGHGVNIFIKDKFYEIPFILSDDRIKQLKIWLDEYVEENQ